MPLPLRSRPQPWTRRRCKRSLVMLRQRSTTRKQPLTARRLLTSSSRLPRLLPGQRHYLFLRSLCNGQVAAVAHVPDPNLIGPHASSGAWGFFLFRPHNTFDRLPKQRRDTLRQISRALIFPSSPLSQVTVVALVCLAFPHVVLKRKKTHDAQRRWPTRFNQEGGRYEL